MPCTRQGGETGRAALARTVLTMEVYRARVDAQGKPFKDADGWFLKMEKQAGWGAGYPDDLRNGGGVHPLYP
jgi:hypothetical protein